MIMPCHGDDRGNYGDCDTDTDGADREHGVVYVNGACEYNNAYVVGGGDSIDACCC